MDMICIREFKVNLTLDQILEPAIALDLANELRQQKPVISIYPLHKMKTGADANDGYQKDEGVTLVGNSIRKKENHNVKLADLNKIFQRIMIFLTSITWACGKHGLDDSWTRSPFETVKKHSTTGLAETW